MSGILNKRLDEITYTVFDFETTGMSYTQGDKVVEFAFIKYSFADGIIAEFTSKVNPQRYIPTDVSAIHGIYDHHVANAPIFSYFTEDILKFIEGTVLVGHNVYFDMRFLTGELASNNIEIDKPHICTMSFPGFLNQKTRQKLGIACKNRGISLINAHSALGDTRATTELFHNQILDAKELSLDTFSDLKKLKKSYKFISSWNRNIK